jgi:hypothetical protein
MEYAEQKCNFTRRPSFAYHEGQFHARVIPLHRTKASFMQRPGASRRDTKPAAARLFGRGPALR